MIPPLPADKRIAKRFDKSFQVTVFSELFGEFTAVARNISEGGLCIELAESLPLGSVLTVSFSVPGQRLSVSARAEVKHHYCFNYNVGEHAASARGIGLRFIEFLEDSDEHPQESFTRHHSIH